MDARAAELIYEAVKEAIIKALLEMDAWIADLGQKVLVLQKKIVSLSTNSTDSSKPPSCDGPQVQKNQKGKIPPFSRWSKRTQKRTAPA